jgi:TATA element modulatory factor
MDQIKQEFKSLELKLLHSQSETQSQRDTINALESQLTDTQISITKEKESLQEQFEIDLETRLKEERTKREEEQMSYTPPPLSVSIPYPKPRNTPKSNSPQPEAIRSRAQRTTSYSELSHFRRPSRHLSSLEISSPSPNLEDDDERDFLTSSRADSPRNTVVDAVSVSASTSAVGPSVNIIERMSSALRRLESDLAATKEEMSRSIKQRDEARDECVKLMSEVEEKRRFQESVQKIQVRYDDLENRYFRARKG